MLEANCSHDGFFICNGIAGGTGSGLGSRFDVIFYFFKIFRVLEEIRNDYPKKYIYSLP